MAKPAQTRIVSRSASQRRRPPQPIWWRRPRNIVIAFVGVGALIVAAVVIAARSSGHPQQAVQAVGSPNGNQLHQFDANHHAPFIALADYYPIWQRHDPNYVLVDVREAGERSRSYIPNDVWAPLADAQTTGWQYLEKFKGKTLVLYCDCPWAEAATYSSILEAHGFTDADVRVLHEGIPGWAQAGYPVVPGGNVCAGASWPQACSGS